MTRNVHLLNVRHTCFSDDFYVRAIQCRLFNVSIIIPVDQAIHIINSDTPIFHYKHMLYRVVVYFKIQHFNGVHLLYLLIWVTLMKTVMWYKG